MGFWSSFANTVFGAGASSDISSGYHSAMNNPTGRARTPPARTYRRKQQPVNNFRDTSTTNVSPTKDIPIWGGSQEKFANNWTPDVTSSLGMDKGLHDIWNASATVDSGMFSSVKSSVLHPSSLVKAVSAGVSAVIPGSGALTSLIGGVITGTSKYSSAVDKLVKYDPSGVIFPGAKSKQTELAQAPKFNISAPGLQSAGGDVRYAFAGTRAAKKANVVIPGSWSKQTFDTSTINGQYQKEWSNLRDYYSKNSTPVDVQKGKFTALTTKYQGLYNTEVKTQQAAFDTKAKAAMAKAVADETARRTAGITQGKSDYSSYIDTVKKLTGLSGSMDSMRRAGRFGGQYAKAAKASYNGLVSSRDSLLGAIKSNKYVTMSGEAKGVATKGKSEQVAAKKPSQYGAIAGALTQAFAPSSFAKVKYYSLLGG